jgi:membrane protease YdiL (CAAX protease family)
VTGAAMVLGALAEATAWLLVALKRGTVWTVVTPVLAILGLVTFLVDAPPGATTVGDVVAIVAGIVVGGLLYLATRAFAWVVRGWAGFGRQSREMYARRSPLTLVQALLVSSLIAAPSEELFWRGFFQTGMVDAVGGGAGTAALVTTAIFTLANVPSLNVAIVLGAVVGGGVWSALAWWSGGVIAPLVCHVVWTALMLGFPVVSEPAEVAV